MCVQVTKTANRFEINSLLEKILLKQVRWCLTLVGLYISLLSISAWNVHGLGDKINNNFFVEKLSSDINILLETWTGVKQKANLQDYLSISKCGKRKRDQKDLAEVSLFYTKRN